MSYASLNPNFSSVTIGVENLKLPLTSSTSGQIVINSFPSFHTFGTENVFAGPNAGNFTLSGSTNTGVGNQSLQAVTGGVGNSSIGSDSLFSLTSGNTNTAVGINSLENLLTGSSNLALGFSDTLGGAGLNYNGAESKNIVLSNTGTTGDTGVIRIGDANQTKCFIAGSFGVTVTGSALLMSSAGQLGTVASSRQFKENIAYVVDSSPLLKLKPATFNFKSDETKTKRTGLIAEDVHEIMPELVLYDDNEKPYSVQYHELPVLLLNELKKVVKRLDALEKAK